MSTICSDATRTWYLSPTGKRHYVEPGWEKGWIFENVYGWHWIGPIDKCPLNYNTIVNLVVLGYEPTLEERKSIQHRFKNAPPPKGGELAPDPFEIMSLSERQCSE